MPKSLLAMDGSSFSGCSSLEKIEIPPLVKEIGVGTFAHCDNLKTISIPGSVEVIHRDPIWNCRNLEHIYVDVSNTHYISEDDVLYDSAKTEILKLPAAKQLKHFTIPDSISRICSYAFDGCESLVSIIISNSVKEIGACAFSGCTSLESLDIPASVTKINTTSFSNCKSLKELHLHSLNPDIVDTRCGAFDEYDYFVGLNTENCTLYVPIGTGYAYRHHHIWSKFKEVVIERPQD